MYVQVTLEIRILRTILLYFTTTRFGKFGKPCASTRLYFIVHASDVFLEVGGDAETFRTVVAGKVADVEVDEILVLLQAVPVVQLLATN